MKKYALLLACLATIIAFSQETKWAYQTFRDTRVINGQSVEMNPKGEAKFIIAHRFGTINGGFYDMFGLDYGTIRYGLDCGITDKLTLGVGRSSVGKTYDAFLKRKLTYQKSGTQNFPFSIVYYASIAANTERWADTTINNFVSSKLSYTHQLIIARKANDRFSYQLMPTIVHRNLVEYRSEANTVFAMGLAGRYQVTKVMAVQFEYYIAAPRQLAARYKNAFSLGFEFQTKGHVFQFHLSNATGMIEPIFITETVNAWHGLGVGLGFNITRDFKFAPRNYNKK